MLAVKTLSMIAPCQHESMDRTYCNLFLPTITLKECGLDFLQETGLFYLKMDVQLGVAKAGQIVDGEELESALETFNYWKPALNGSEPEWVDELNELIKQHVQETEDAWFHAASIDDISMQGHALLVLGYASVRLSHENCKRDHSFNRRDQLESKSYPKRSS